MASFSLDSPVFQSYFFYAAVLCVKMLLMSVLTARQRAAKKVFANPEDVASRRGAKLKLDDPDVERVRRAHRNDLENIPVFLALGLLYALTGPSAWLATLLFRLYAAGRVLHTVVYAMVVLPQPARALAWGVPYLVSLYMGIQVLMYYATAL